MFSPRLASSGTQAGGGVCPLKEGGRVFCPGCPGGGGGRGGAGASQNTCHLPWVTSRVSFETSFDSKQPKLEPKLVSALSETKRLFRLFRFCTETESFDVLIEPKQTGDQPK